MTVDFQKISLWLNVCKTNKRKLKSFDLYYCIYHTNSYSEVKSIFESFRKLNYRFTKNDYFHTIYFIEDFDDCKKIVDFVRQNYRTVNFEFLRQLVYLSDTKEKAIKVVNESKQIRTSGRKILQYGISDHWLNFYGSIETIKNVQNEWKNITYPNFMFNKSQMIEMEDREIERAVNNYIDSLSNSKLKEMSKVIISRVSQQTVNVYSRNLYVKEFALKVAHGKCQLCEHLAPFKNHYGKPFLEVHHIDFLSNGGSDSIENVVALCPNCHRKMHILAQDEDIKQLKIKTKGFARFL